MGFQIKDFASITASILNHARATTQKITDWLPGSVARTIVEAPAVEIEELYMQFFVGLRDAIPTATFRSFNFDLLPAAFARGFVTVSVETPPTEALTVPAGTVFTTPDDRRYLSTLAVTWAVGASSVQIPVMADTAGAAYNVAEGVIDSSLFFDATYTVTNAAITTGRDEETGTEREARFADFVASLSRGTVVACTNAVKNTTLRDAFGNITEYVTRVGVLENPGYVRRYIYSSAGLPSAELLAEAQLVLDGYRTADGQIVPGFRPGGVRSDVLPMTNRPVPLTAAVQMQPGYSLTTAVQQELRNVFSTALASMPSGGVLYAGDIKTALLSVTGVAAVILDTDENIHCGVFEVLVPGTMTITEMT